MWMWIVNKFAKFHAKRLNQSENIPKSFMGATFFLNTRYIIVLQWCLCVSHVRHLFSETHIFTVVQSQWPESTVRRSIQHICQNIRR